MNFKDSHRDPKEQAGELAESHSYGERWEDFEDMFDEFDPVSDEVEGIWQESDERQKKKAELDELLKEFREPPFDEEVATGLKEALGFFSKKQMEELSRMIDHIGEGHSEQEGRESFEKSSKTEEVDQVLSEQVLDEFDQLLQKFYAIIGRFAAKNPGDDRLQGLTNVAWTAIQACAMQIQRAVREGKSVTEINLIVLRFDQQLDALDPEHAFVPGEGD